MEVRNIKYQEELKNIFENVYREEGMSHAQWQYKYQEMKKGADMELFGEAIERFVQMGKTLEEATDILETMFREKMTYSENAT